MTPEEIDTILVQATGAAAVDPAVTDRAKQRILASLRPVRPLAPAWFLTAGLFVVFGIVAVAGAAALGMHGWHVLNAAERAVVFAAITGLAFFAAVASTREMRPAGGTRRSGLAFASAAAGVLLVFAFLFHDYGMRNFVTQGVPCLLAGLSFALLAALLASFIMRRGFVLNLVPASVAVGTLAGLAGMGVLELHCPNLRAMHVMFWHVAVVVLSGIAGFLVGWILQRGRRFPAPSTPS